MKPKAILFDVDGTLANTERWGHLPASNEALRAVGLPFQWDWTEFKKLALVPGSDNRLRQELEKRNYSANDIVNYIVKFLPLKKKFYVEKYGAEVKLRTGVKEFVQEAIKADIRLAIVSVSYEAQIHALLDNELPDEKAYFNPILGKESGIKTGSEGVLYKKCLQELGLKPEECVAIEDSPVGLAAARKEGIPTLVFYNDFSKNEKFVGAELVESSIANIDTKKVLDGVF